MNKDAERYRRLAILVEAGEWAVCQSETIDSYGSTKDIWMDDKDMLDKFLDRDEVIESAKGWETVLKIVKDEI